MFNYSTKLCIKFYIKLVWTWFPALIIGGYSRTFLPFPVLVSVFSPRFFRFTISTIFLVVTLSLAVLCILVWSIKQFISTTWISNYDSVVLPTTCCCCFSMFFWRENPLGINHTVSILYIVFRTLHYHYICIYITATRI